MSLAYYLKVCFSVTILYGEKEADEEEALYMLKNYPSLEIKKISHYQRSINLFKDYKAYRLIKKEVAGMDVVHTHGFKSGFLGRLAAHAAGVSCIVHTFHGHLFHSYYNSFFSSCIIAFERWLGRFTNKIIAISERQEYELAEQYKIVPRNKLAVIYLGIDEKTFFRNQTNLSTSFREKFDLKEDTIAIGIIGRIVKVKNFSLFVQVVSKLIAAGESKLKFFVIGDGMLKSSVQQQLSEAGIAWSESDNYSRETTVLFTSWIPEIAAAIEGLDIIMLTSHNEGTPVSLIEAQLCGKPVVATDVGGVRDTFINNKTGFLVQPGNADEFAGRLGELIANKTLRESMGTKSVAFAKQRFSKNTEVEKLKQLYKDCQSIN